MRPMPIPDEAIVDGMRRIVIAAPDGDLTNEHIAPVEAIAWLHNLGGQPAPVITMLVALDDGDLDRLRMMERPAMWLSMFTAQIPPFSVEVADGRGE